MRSWIAALLAATALPGVAAAQELSATPDEPAQLERSAGPRSEPRAQHAEPQLLAQRDGRDERRGDGGNRWNGGGRAEAGATVQRDRGGRGDGRWGARTRTDADVQLQRDRGGNRWDGNARADAGAAVQADRAPTPATLQNDGRRDRDGRRDWDRGSDGRRDWNRGNDGRRDWDRNDRRDDDRRGWDGRNDGRNGWNGRNDWNRNDGYRSQGRWNGGRNDRNWDRGWRTNSRYDWQRFRSGNRYAFRLPRYAAPYGWNYGYRRYSIGATLFSGLFAQNYWINDPWTYRLPPAEWPFQWVRYYNDALLIDARTGSVVDVIPEIFWY